MNNIELNNIYEELGSEMLYFNVNDTENQVKESELNKTFSDIVNETFSEIDNTTFSEILNETDIQNIHTDIQNLTENSDTEQLFLSIHKSEINDEFQNINDEFQNINDEFQNINDETITSEIENDTQISEKDNDDSYIQKYNIKPCCVKLTKLKLKSNSSNTSFKLIPIKNNLTKKFFKNKNVLKRSINTKNHKINSKNANKQITKPNVMKSFIKEYKPCFICTKCKIKFRRRKRFNSHVLKLHQNISIKCILKILLECITCKLLFCNAENISTHLCKPKQGNYVEIRKYYCSVCTLECSTYDLCNNHIASIHNNTGKTIVQPKLMYQCDVCFILLDEHSVNEHSCKNISYNCNQCTLTFVNKPDYDTHINTVHNDLMDIKHTIEASMSNLLKVFDIDTSINDEIDINALSTHDSNLMENMIVNNNLDIVETNTMELNDILINDNIFTSDSNLLDINSMLHDDDDNTNCSSFINDIEPMDTDINSIEPSYNSNIMENSNSEIESLNENSVSNSIEQSNDVEDVNSLYYLVTLPSENKETDSIVQENHDPQPIRHNTELEVKKMPSGKIRKAAVVDDRILAANMKFRTYSYCYHCIACNVSFQSMDTFKSHSLNIHKDIKKDETIFQKLIDCDKCELSFQYYELFANHICNNSLSMFVNIIFYYCALCPLVFNSFKLCKNHIFKEHNRDDFNDGNIKIKQTTMCQCRNCFKLFVTRKKLENHRYSSCSDNWCLHCSVCHLSFSTHLNLQSHIIDCHFEDNNTSIITTEEVSNNINQLNNMLTSQVDSNLPVQQVS